MTLSIFHDGRNHGSLRPSRCVGWKPGLTGVRRTAARWHKTMRCGWSCTALWVVTGAPSAEMSNGDVSTATATATAAAAAAGAMAAADQTRPDSDKHRTPQRHTPPIATSTSPSRHWRNAAFDSTFLCTLLTYAARYSIGSTSYSRQGIKYSKDIVTECKRYLGFRDVDELMTQRKRAFLAAFNANDNSIYVTFVNTSLIAFSTNTVIWLYLDLIASIVS